MCLVSICSGCIEQASLNQEIAGQARNDLGFNDALVSTDCFKHITLNTLV